MQFNILYIIIPLIIIGIIYILITDGFDSFNERSDEFD